MWGEEDVDKNGVGLGLTLTRSSALFSDLRLCDV